MGTIKKPEVCNYKYWCKLNMWNLKSSACILTGTEPETLTIAAEKVYLKMKIDRDKGASSLIQHSFNKKRGYFLSSNVVAWALANHIEIPNELKLLLKREFRRWCKGTMPL